MIELDWILTEPLVATRIGNSYIIDERGGQNRRCLIEMKGERMTFDGVDIETEDFMAFVGLLDAIDEEPIGKPVTFARGTDE